MKYLVGVVVIIALFCTITFFPGKQGRTDLIRDKLVSEEYLWEKINEWRINSSLNQYIKDELLCKYASIRLQDIKSNFNHNDFNEDISKQIFSENNYAEIGENLAKDYQSEEQIVINWITSPFHYKNLISDYTNSCIKCEDNFCVQLFAKY